MAALLLTACGQRGPLYLPKIPDAPAKQAKQPAQTVDNPAPDASFPLK